MAHHIELKALRPNVGFLLKEAAGYSRDLDIDLPKVRLADDLLVETLRGKLILNRTSRGIWVHGVLRGTTPAECARCLTDFLTPIAVELEELFYYPPSSASDLSAYVISDDAVLDLVEPLRELVLLAIPIRPMCRPDCRGLCIECGQDLNQGPCGCQPDTIDPRLAKLSQLLDPTADNAE